jgi:hypothetical protein
VGASWRGLSPGRPTSGQRNSVPEAVYAEAGKATEVAAHPTLISTGWEAVGNRSIRAEIVVWHYGIGGL